jgi:hypothetical protein
VLRGSFDHFQDQTAIQMLSAFLTESNIIIAHEPIANKTNEIPTAQQLIETLGLSNYIFTFDPPVGGLSTKNVSNSSKHW